MLFLRPLEPEDLGLLYTIENDPTTWAVSDPAAPYSRFALRQYIERSASFFETGELRLVAEEKDTGEAIGLVDLFNHSPRDRRAEIGIAMLRSKRGEGHGTEALKLMVHHAAMQLHLHSLCAYVCSASNPSSHRCFEKAGFDAVATLPNWHHTPFGWENTTVFQKILLENN